MISLGQKRCAARLRWLEGRDVTWGDGDEDQAVLSRMSPRTSAENGSNWKYHVSCPPSIVPSLLSSCGTWDVLENGDSLTDTAFKNHPHN